MKRVPLDRIVFDAGTQVRAALDQDHVTALADAMTNGDRVPPIILFHDGNHHYIADGFHRYMAAQRLSWREINADVQAGSKADALWYALGANRTNGKNMTPADKRHAILLALKEWPDKSMHQIADQIGCTYQYVQQEKAKVATTCHLPARVTGKDGKSYPASRSVAPLKPGKASTKAAQDERWTRAREMAEEGYTSHQMADEFGVGLVGLRVRLKEHGIDVPADRVTGKLRRHDSTRIMEHIVMDAENLTADVGLIDFDDLDPAQLPGWLASLKASRDKLGEFIRRVMKEQEKHGEAA